MILFTLILRRIEWAVHNIIGHPLMEICFLLGLERLGLWIHDETLPEEDEDYIPICNQYVINEDMAEEILKKIDTYGVDDDKED
jgi:hypothetical protein